ncbi:MAG: phosphatase PAP2 family protein [Clostridia bacterium]|nr:phosphatase PAP2 family protein [Clostridia bacterium]
MEFLKWLQEIRNPVCDAIFSFITMFGEETIFILIGLLFYWCISKKQGYYLLSIGLIGTVLNQFLKLIFRIPRPWVQDESFKIVESAREQATGYSFPSGHTQTSVGIFGGIALWNKNKTAKIICIALCVLVPFSRMYLGVHTPLDVGVSVLLALVLVFGLYPLLRKASNEIKTMRILFVVMTIFASVFLMFVHLNNFPADVDEENLAHGTETAYKMLGVILGLWLSFEIDNRYIKFQTKSVWWVQVLKLVVGLLPILAIKSGLKNPLYMLLGNELIADGFRYFLIAIFAGFVWPITFKYWNKLSKKQVGE